MFYAKAGELVRDRFRNEVSHGRPSDLLDEASVASNSGSKAPGNSVFSTRRLVNQASSM